MFHLVAFGQCVVVTEYINGSGLSLSLKYILVRSILFHFIIKERKEF